jgi:hypothetical protein
VLRLGDVRDVRGWRFKEGCAEVAHAFVSRSLVCMNGFRLVLSSVVGRDLSATAKWTWAGVTEYAYYNRRVGRGALNVVISASSSGWYP